MPNDETPVAPATEDTQTDAPAPDPTPELAPESEPDPSYEGRGKEDDTGKTFHAVWDTFANAVVAVFKGDTADPDDDSKTLSSKQTAERHLTRLGAVQPTGEDNLAVAEIKVLPKD